MNKKLLMPIAILLLIGIAGFVYADVSSTTYVQNDKIQAKNFVYGSTSDNLYLRSTFNIYKGWNLVPIGELGKAPSRGKNTFYGYGDKILGCGLNENFDSWQIKYQYDYIPGKGYLGGKLDYNTGELKEPVKTEVGNALKDYYMPDGNQEGLYSYMFASRWFYSEIDCSYNLDALDLGNSQSQMAWETISNKVKLNAGWNLISILPSFLDKKLGDSFGDCKVLNANQWNPVKQKWEYSSSESAQRVNDLLNIKISEDNLYIPLAIKVESNCNFGRAISTQPPAIPN